MKRTNVLALLAFAPLWLVACGGGGGGSSTAAVGNGGAAPAESSATATPASDPSTGAGPPPASASTWTGPVHVGTTSASQSGPALARLASGQIAVAWPTTEPGTQQVRVQRYDDSGAAVGAATRIDTASTPSTFMFMPSPQTASIAATPEGYVVAWCAFQDAGSDSAGHPNPGWDAFMRRFDAEGTPLGAVLQLNSESTHVCSMPSVTALAGGRIGVAYWAYRYPFMPGFFPGHCNVRTFDASGTSSAEVNLGDANSCTLAGLSDGGFAVALDRPHYIGDRGVFFRRFDPTGTQVGAEVFVDGAPGNTFDPTPDAHDPDSATLPDGTLLLAWVSDGAVVARQFTPAGVAAAGQVQLAATGSLPAVAATSDGAAALTWLAPSGDTDEIWTQSFGAGGAPRDPAQRLASFVRGPTTPHGHDVVAGGGGHYVVGWQEPAASGSYDVLATRR